MPPDTPHLFAVLLGGRAPNCRVELHDVAFAVGHSLEDTHSQLLDQWFGTARGLHVDAYAVVDQVEGFRVALAPEPQHEPPSHLYFVNIGGYRPGEFAEQHAYALIAAANKTAAKARARKTLLQGHSSVHKDDLFEIDDLIELRAAQGWHVHLHPDSTASAPEVINGYFPLPAQTIRAWKNQR